MITTPTSQLSLQPHSGESPERFAIRAHRDLASRVKDPDRRNAIVRKCWEKTHGPMEAERLARQTFDPSRYELVRDVCVFMEHAVKDGEKERRYDARELARIVRNNNERIVELGAFPAISDGHTDDEDPDRDPDILGYAGGFRLGQIGRKEPCWAIFQDEYRAKDSLDILARKPRRSVELWTYQDSGRSHFDPIAALGANAPRLPLPIRFAQFRQDGATVTRYSAAAVPVMAGGTNTSPKGFGRKRPTTKYQEKCAMISPEDKAEIVDAIATLPQFQFLDKLMQSKKVMGLVEADDYQADEEDELDIALEVPADKAPPVEEEEDFGDLLDEKPSKFAQHQYAAGKGGAAIVQRYQALQKSHQKLIRDHGQLHDQVQEMRMQNADVNRRARLQQLEHDYPHFVDADEEASQTLYSAGASLSDEQFESHVANLEKYAQRSSPVTRMVPTGDNPVKASKEQYAQRRSEIAVRLCTAASDAGKQMSWEEGLAQAEKQLAG